MTSAARIASWLMLAATLPLIGDTEQEDLEKDLKNAMLELEAAIEAFAEVESELVVESVSPFFQHLQPLTELLPEVLTDAVSVASVALQLGRLGISVASPTDDGIPVYHVHPKSSAAQSGLRPHDTIVSINGETVETILDDPEQVQMLVSGVDENGDPLLFVAVRDGEELEIKVDKKAIPGSSVFFHTGDAPVVTFEAPPNAQTWTTWVENNPNIVSLNFSGRISVLEIEEEIGHYFGVEFGVLVVDTPDDHDQLKPGDVVLRIDGNPIRSYSHVDKYSAKASSSETVKVRIKRRGRTMNVDFSPKEWFLAPVYKYE
ncbi:MAG: PDZ domain-containing protein [Gammaproteobacteria bacterium]|nr:PDZ domain-containing protein [Gammaproteobacteria bacterium]MYD79772.1 PDZ domain-containing protein [Gammaproteobacteria bacterium]